MLTVQDVYSISYDSAHLPLLDLEGKAFHFNVKAQFRPNSVRSTYVFPQLEANTRIPVRLYAVSVGVEPPPCVNCGAS